MSSEDNADNKKSSVTFWKIVSAILFITIIIYFSFFSFSLSFFNNVRYKANLTWDGRKIFFEALKNSPNSCKAHYFVAGTYFEQKEWAKALVELKKTLEIEPDYCDVYYGMGVCEFQLGNQQKGHDFLEKGLDCWQIFSDCYNTLISIYKFICLLKFFREYLSQGDKNKIAVYIHWAEMLKKANLTSESGYAFAEVSSQLFNYKAPNPLVRKEYDKLGIEYAKKASEVSGKNCTNSFIAAQLLTLNKYQNDAAELYEVASFPYTCKDHYKSSLEMLYNILKNKTIDNPNDFKLKKHFNYTEFRTYFILKRLGNFVLTATKKLLKYPYDYVATFPL